LSYDIKNNEFIERTAVVPKNLLNPDGVLILTFRIEGARSPDDLGISSDERKLGISISKFKLLSL